MALDLIAIRRDLHQYPEVAHNEYRTAEVIGNILQTLGLNPRRVAKTGVVCEIPGNGNEPMLALRADIDALPIQEQSGLEYASKNPGVMHACGHDVHATILLGVAEQLAQRQAGLRRGVRLIFQPAEEGTTGARELIAAGVLDNVSSIVGLHNYPLLPVGKAAFRAGPLMAASSRFQITITGKGGHAASPHLSADPIVAGAAVVSGLQQLVSRVAHPLEPLVVTVGAFQAGSAFNIIPETAEMLGTVRCFSMELRKSVGQWMTETANDIAAGYRCKAQVEYTEMMPSVNNDPALTQQARQAAASVLGEENLSEAEQVLAAEDFSLYQQIVPGCFFWLGSGGTYHWHHPAYAIDEKVLPTGVRTLSAIALKLLS
jgi:amidohydrolase